MYPAPLPTSVTLLRPRLRLLSQASFLFRQGRTAVFARSLTIGQQSSGTDGNAPLICIILVACVSIQSRPKPADDCKTNSFDLGRVRLSDLERGATTARNLGSRNR